MKKKNIYLNKVTVVGFVKNLLIIMKKKLEIIVTWLVNLEIQLTGVVANFQLTEKVPILFHNLRGYDSHLIFCEPDKFDVKIGIISNGLEKCMTFFKIKT